MPGFELVRGKQTHGYPAPVIDLARFLILNPQYWSVVAHYLHEVWDYSETEMRQRKYNLLVGIHLDRRLRSTKKVGALWSLLESLYGLASRRLEPRGRFLEFLVYKAGPIRKSSRRTVCLRRENQCSLWERTDDGRLQSLVQSQRTFDVAFLGSRWFEGYECKAKVRNFVPFGLPPERWNRDAARKLEFMRETHRQATKRGLESTVYLAGLDEDCEDVRRNLQQYGFSDILVVGQDDLDQLFD